MRAHNRNGTSIGSTVFAQMTAECESVDGSFSRQFSSIYIVRELSPDEVGNRSRGSGFWKKNDPLREDFENFVPKGFTMSQNHVLCVNFVKFGRPEIGKVVHYLPDKKTKIGLLSRSRFCADCAEKSVRASY